MITINLLPVREERKKAEALNHAFLAIVCVVVACGAVFMYNSALERKIEDRRAQVASLQKQAEKYKSQLSEVESFKKQKKSIEEKLNVINDLNRSRSGPVRMMDELAIRTPKTIWIKELNAEGGVITMKGVGLNNEVVAEYLSTLGASEYFSDVTLETIKRATEKGLKVSDFEIHAKLASPTEQNDTKGDPSSAASSAKVVDARTTVAG